MAATTAKNDPISMYEFSKHFICLSINFSLGNDKMSFRTQLVDGKPQIFFDPIGLLFC